MTRELVPVEIRSEPTTWEPADSAEALVDASAETTPVCPE
jgi:hypothetical protein